MTGNLDYRWRLRELMALRGLYLHLLIVLCEILDCKADDLIERVQAVPVKKRAAGSAAGADLVPKPARVSRPGGA